MKWSFSGLIGDSNETNTTRLHNEYLQIAEDLEFQGEQHLPEVNTYILAAEKNVGSSERTPVEKLFRKERSHDEVGAIKAVLEPSQELVFENPPDELSDEVEIDQTDIPNAVYPMTRVYFEQLPQILERNDAELGEHALNLEFTIHARFDPSDSEGYQIPYSAVFEAENFMENVETRRETSDKIPRSVNSQLNEHGLDFIQRENYKGSDRMRHYPNPD